METINIDYFFMIIEPNYISLYSKIFETNDFDENNILNNLLNKIIENKLEQKDILNDNLKNIILFNFYLSEENKISNSFPNTFIDEITDIFDIKELKLFFLFFNTVMLHNSYVVNNIDKLLILKVFNNLLTNLNKYHNSLLRGELVNKD